MKSTMNFKSIVLISLVGAALAAPVLAQPGPGMGGGPCMQGSGMRNGAGMGPGGELEWMNHADAWLRVALGFLGIEDVQVIAAEGEEGNPEAFRASYQQAEKALADLAESEWARA